MNALKQSVFKIASLPSSMTSRLLSSETKRKVERVTINELRLLGRVGVEPELRGTQENLVTFPLATNTIWRTRDNEEEKVKTEWHRIVIVSASLRNRVMAMVQRGDRVYIEGSVQYNSYIDQAGKRSTSAYVLATRLLNLTNRAFKREDTADAEINEEDIPAENAEIANDTRV